MNRTTTALCAAGLLLLAAVPLGTAHLTNPDGSLTSGLLTQGNDICRRGGDAGDRDGPDCTDALNNGVSGTYVGPATAIHVISDAFPIYTPELILFPLGYAEVFVNALCDIEVGGGGGGDDGGLSDKILSEKVVDNEGDDNDNNLGNDGDVGLIIPDGTFDDGGQGCAVHTAHYNGNHYLADLVDGTGPGAACDPPTTPFGTCPTPWEFNTYGCDGEAFSGDLVSGDNGWIETQCLDNDVTSFDILDCLINDVVFALDVLYAEVCITTEILILTTGTGAGTIVGCGNSVSSHANQFGVGGDGVDYPSAQSGCTQANAGVLVHNALDLRGGTPELHLGTAGWIDTDPDGVGGSEVIGGVGTVPDICAQTISTTDPDFNRTYDCAVPVPAGCHGGAVVVHVSGPVFTGLLTTNNVDGQATGTATCGVNAVNVVATYGAPPWDGVNAGQGALTGTAPACSVAFTGAAPNSATFAYAQCFIA